MDRFLAFLLLLLSLLLLLAPMDDLFVESARIWGSGIPVSIGSSVLFGSIDSGSDSEPVAADADGNVVSKRRREVFDAAGDFSISFDVSRRDDDGVDMLERSRLEFQFPAGIPAPLGVDGDGGGGFDLRAKTGVSVISKSERKS